MDSLFENTKKMINGQIGSLEYMGELYTVYRNLATLTSSLGVESLSYLESAKTGISYIEDASMEDSKLRLEALLCGIFNDFRHSLQFGRKAKNANKIEEYRNILSGLKKTMIIEITKECKKVGNNAYGFSIDYKGVDVFAVDIPTCGQISWHLPGKMRNNLQRLQLSIRNKKYAHK